jgi:hypothetical protein
VLPSLTDGFAGVTTMRSTGASCTVIDDVPVLPPALAEIVTLPGATPVTTPVADTVATDVLLDDQVNWTPGMALPLALRAVAVSVEVQATFTDANDGEIVTLAIGNWTVTDADALFPSIVAVMVAVPAPTPVTTPVDDTVATAAALVLHVASRPVMGTPAESFGVAVRVVVPPIKRVAVAGDTTTVATGTIFTVSVAEACRPSTVTTTMPVPGANAVTNPPLPTLVMDGVLVDQLTLRPVSDRDCPVALRAMMLS